MTSLVSLLQTRVRSWTRKYEVLCHNNPVH